MYRIGLETWLKPKSTCLASVKSYVQTPVLPKKKKMYRVFMKMNTWAEVEWGDKNKEERRIKVN
jgi:hypothetical protein